ncbi:hypothetical protein [Sporosarcina sp. NPDC096371]|uniref:hypothetical protein n=1 Tax=Sporosarcina sp. NPDC096371 TaxID=3364530 RepID=UPI00382F0D5A
MKNVTHELEATAKKLQQQTKSYLDDIKKLIAEPNDSNKVHVISYFTYSLNISHNSEHSSLCLGSYHIHNISSHPITNPYICIKIPTKSPFSFSGRYVYENFKQSLKNASQWERINEKTNTEEFWLRPLGKASIEPNETITFSNFQIKWSPTTSYSGSIMGFTYSDQSEEGIAVINPINLNGTIPILEDEK